MRKTIISLLAISLAAASSASANIEFLTGHLDIGPVIEDGALHFELHAHEEEGHEEGEHEHEEEFGILVPNLVSQTLGSAIPATGVGAGGTIWILPQSNPMNESIPFLGIATDELVPTDWSSQITYTLGTVTSPSGSGHFSLWQSDNGLEFYFSTADASLTENGNNTLLQAANGAHDHFNWGFSEEGLWEVELTASGTHNTLGALSATETFTFSVVPEPSSYAFLAGLVAVGFACVRRR